MRARLAWWSWWLCLSIASSASGVAIEWTPIGDPGNACDPQPLHAELAGGCFGSVDHPYNIATYEVTTAQYVEFLNAVAAVSDPNGLWSEPMAFIYGGITRSGVSGAYTYTAIPGREDMPANHVTFWDAIRFVNWLQNGQPVGSQGIGTTETGTYTITAQGISNNSIARNALGPGTIVLPNENEWYKAAYYNAAIASYLDYPAGSDSETTCAAPTASPNTANCYLANRNRQNPYGDLADVGSYPGSASPYRTFDQGGNVKEWNETIIATSRGSRRGLRGGAIILDADNLAALFRSADDPWFGSEIYGFRVAMLVAPEPGTGLLVLAGLAGLAGTRARRP